MDERDYWIAFNHIRGVGAVRFRRLLAEFGSLQSAWSASPGEIRSAGLDERTLLSIQTERKRIDPGALAARIRGAGIAVLTWSDPEYPRRLKEMPLPPPVIYCRGAVSEADETAVALVGTRRATAYGREVARWFAARLAECRVTVVSGLARGIDSESHEACLVQGGRTLAVLGCGVDIPYPPEHHRLAERMAASGAVLSDYPPGTPPDAANFPPRNRIIAGLTLATIVVEAGETSGALLTAKYAADFGRDVFAVPGSVLSPAHRGCNRLIADGAAPAVSPEEVLAALRMDVSGAARAAQTLLPADPLEEKILRMLSRQPVHIDVLRAELSIPVESLSAALAMMELKGFVRQAGGMQFVLCGPTRGITE